jgi:hypothetical protein
MNKKENLKDKNLLNNEISLKYYYLYFVLSVIVIGLIILFSGCNSQIITVEQPFVLAVDKCFCKKIISEKIVIQSDKGYKYLFKDFENYKAEINDVEFDTTKIGSEIVANWYQNIILK